MRIRARAESPGAHALYFLQSSMIGTRAILPWRWVLYNRESMPGRVKSAFFGGFAQMAMTRAFRVAEAARRAPFE